MKLFNDYIKSIPFGKSDNVNLTCNIDNGRAIHTYEKLGFKDTGELDGDEIIMKIVILHS